VEYIHVRGRLWHKVAMQLDSEQMCKVTRKVREEKKTTEKMGAGLDNVYP